MRGLIGLLCFAAQFADPMALDAGATFDSIGRMPEVVVTAPRYYNEDTSYIGMMPEVIVIAERYPASVGDMRVPEKKDSQDSNWIYPSDMPGYLLLVVMAGVILIAGVLVYTRFLNNRILHKQMKVNYRDALYNEYKLCRDNMQCPNTLS